MTIQKTPRLVILGEIVNKEPKSKLVNGTASNKRGRPVGAKNKRTIIRDALQFAFSGGEGGFWLAMAQLAAGGDMQAATMLADRLMPKLKPQAEAVRLDLPLNGTPGQMAHAIMQAVAVGQITPDAGRELLAALADVCRIVETTDLQTRIETLEQRSTPHEIS